MNTCELSVYQRPRQDGKIRTRVPFRAMVAGALFFHLAAAQAATLTVVSKADSGPGTLRQAISDAAPSDTINFAIHFASLPHQVALTSGELLINKNLTINGPGADKLAVGGFNAAFGIFHMAPASVTATISGLTILNGGSTDRGGGIFNTGTLTINNCTISNNSAGEGTGVANDGFLTITNSTISGNIGFAPYGGAIANTGTLAVANSTISNNIIKVPIHYAAFGGGIANRNGGTLIITNSTLSGNSIIGCGGGIYTDAVSSTTARSTIIAINTSGGNGPDICGALTSQGFNLAGNNAGATITPPQLSDLIGVPGAPIDPLLGALQNNGGPTFTQALQPNSPAINGGDPNAPARDQRNYIRSGAADIGAFEFSGTIPVTLANISTRLSVETGDNVLIGGFIITGTQQKKVILRAIGPSLNLDGELADPLLELHDSSGAVIASNDNWRSDQEAEIIATGIPPSNDLESAIVATLPANGSAYTAIVRGVNNGTGIGVVEAYDLNRTVDSKLGNISTRGLVQAGDNVLIGGLIVLGQDALRVMVRAIGPSLNLSGKLADPTLELHDGDGALIASNDNWRSDQEAEIIATGIPPSNDLESAIVRTLTPGNYTAIVRGVNDTTGVALVEVYGLY